MLRRRTADSVGDLSRLSCRFFDVTSRHFSPKEAFSCTFIVLANSGENECRHTETTVRKSGLPKITEVLKQLCEMKAYSVCQSCQSFK